MKKIVFSKSIIYANYDQFLNSLECAVNYGFFTNLKIFLSIGCIKNIY